MKPSRLRSTKVDHRTARDLSANGVTYYGDETRPSVGIAGGAYFKFVPTALYDPSSGPISNVADSRMPRA